MDGASQIETPVINGKNRTRLSYVLEMEGIRQTELSETSNISLGTINRVCNGKQTVSITTQSKIVKSINELCGKRYANEEIFPY